MALQTTKKKGPKKGGPSPNPAGRPKGIVTKLSQGRQFVKDQMAKRAAEEAAQDALNEATNGPQPRKPRYNYVPKGTTPLEYMNMVLCGDGQEFSKIDRMWASQQAAPYMHRKMPIAIEGTGKPVAMIDATKLASMSTEDLEKMLASLTTLNITPEDDK